MAIESTKKRRTHGVLDDNATQDQNNYVPDVPDVDERNIFLLPTDIIKDILSRLNFRQVLVCRSVCRASFELLSSADFNSQFHHATPVLVSQSNSKCSEVICDKKTNNHGYCISLDFIDQKAHKKMVLFTHFCLSDVVQYNRLPSLLGSYNGFLVFQHYLDNSVFIFNPVTLQEVLVPTPNFYKPCGLYFHPAANEYMLLLLRKYYFPAEFLILGLKSKLSRRTPNFNVAPCTCRLPIILNGALHWMASSVDCSSSFDEPRRHKISILVFNIENEGFTTMLHPGRPCYSKDKHRSLQLVEMDGNLCLCDFSISTGKIHLWVLDNYAEKVWVNTHIIKISALKREKSDKFGYHPYHGLQAIQIQNDQLLLRTSSMGLIFYHLKSNLFRKKYSDGSTFAHTYTLEWLQTGEVISCGNLNKWHCCVTKSISR